MRKNILLWLLSAVLLLSSVEVISTYATSSDNQAMVWICTGKYSKRYHKSENGCKGMQACKGQKLKVTQQEAEASGRTPCGFCY